LRQSLSSRHASSSLRFPASSNRREAGRSA
jgi:hypothetical protein